MKYLYTIISIIIIISVIVLYEINKKEKIEDDIALIINNKIITKDEFDKLYSFQTSHVNSKEEFIDTLITKELLIQESQKEGIDKEESFRRSLQNYYEQSLIKLLIDRKFSTLNIDVKEDEVEKYINLLDKKIYLTIYKYKNLEDLSRATNYEIEQISSNFSDLSEDIRCSIISINKGESTEPIKISGRYLVIRLDDIKTSLPKIKEQSIDRESIGKTIKEFKKDRLINMWIDSLRKKATIKVFVNK